MNRLRECIKRVIEEQNQKEKRQVNMKWTRDAEAVSMEGMRAKGQGRQGESFCGEGRGGEGETEGWEHEAYCSLLHSST